MLKIPQGEEVPATETSSRTRTNSLFPKKIPAIVSFVGEAFAPDSFPPFCNPFAFDSFSLGLLVVEVIFPEASGTEDGFAGID